MAHKFVGCTHVRCVESNTRDGITKGRTYSVREVEPEFYDGMLAVEINANDRGSRAWPDNHQIEPVNTAAECSVSEDKALAYLKTQLLDRHSWPQSDRNVGYYAAYENMLSDVFGLKMAEPTFVPV